MSNKHTIHSTHHHYGWDHSFSPVMTVAPGDSVEFATIDASGGQLTVNSSAADVAALDPNQITKRQVADNLPRLAPLYLHAPYVVQPTNGGRLRP